MTAVHYIFTTIYNKKTKFENYEAKLRKYKTVKTNNVLNTRRGENVVVYI